MEWMLDIQLGRRNLTPIQRISVTEKYRPIYEKQALLNKQIAIQKANLENPKYDTNDSILPNVVKTNPIDTTKKLAEIAGVGKETYRQAKRVLDSTDEELKQRVLSGETSISAGYKDLTEFDNS